MKIGVTLGYGENTEQNFRWCVENGIMTCQLAVGIGDYTDETVERLNALRKAAGMEITALIGAATGPAVYDFYSGPLTIGIVAPGWQGQRAKELAESARFAARLGVPRVCGHMGFIPENPNDPAYAAGIASARWLAKVYKQTGIGLDFETGQETPITLLRAIEDIDSPSIGVNFDPANLLMYGKANPVDALDIIGKYVRGVHAKDGDYPQNPRNLGPEKPLGEGRVDFPALVQKLRDIGYDGPLTIEREISGDKQKEDIKKANSILQKLIGQGGNK
ncbi:MAG: sugar phosphate isomerase/epimerase [Treponema sp.]|jgi:sugar phosphate isomerase/epimerase|nr:sugar phosphate isomerase/epimerase [Treponema sp.]